MTLQTIGPAIVGAAGYANITGPHLDETLRHIQVYTQERVYFGSVLDRIATSPFIKNKLGPSKGSTIRFSTMSSVGVHPVDDNGRYKQSDIDVSYRDITLGDMWGWMFKISNKDSLYEPQYVRQIVLSQMEGIARSMQTRLSQKVILKMIAEASSQNRGHFAGMRDHQTNLGTPDEPLMLTPDNILLFLQDLHYVGAQMGLQENQMFALLPPWMRVLLSRASPLTNAAASGLATTSLLMSPDQVGAISSQMDMLFSYDLPTIAPSTLGNLTTVYPIVFGSPSATGYAVFADSMQVIDKTKGEASTYYQGQILTGDAVLEPCMLAVAHVTVDPVLLTAFPYTGPAPAPAPAPAPLEGN